MQVELSNWYFISFNLHEIKNAEDIFYYGLWCNNLCEAKPNGDHFTLKKLECVLHGRKKLKKKKNTERTTAQKKHRNKFGA